MALNEALGARHHARPCDISIYLSIYLVMHLSIYLYFHLSYPIYLSLNLSIYRSISMHVAAPNEALGARRHARPGDLSIDSIYFIYLSVSG